MQSARKILILVLILAAAFALAQEKPATSHSPAKPATAKASTNLPSEEVVNAFMHEMFGYDSSLSWKIKPSSLR